MSVESQEFVRWRSDQYAAASHGVEREENPEREHEPVKWCRFCEDNPCMPESHACEECFNGINAKE